MRCAAPSKCRTAWSSGTLACLPSAASEFRVGIHVGDVVEESDGDLMGDGVSIAARLEGLAKPGVPPSLLARADEVIE
jgi:adenylate cyclase